MQIQLCLFLIIAVPALVTASHPNNNCIVGCKCKEDNSYHSIVINGCDSPLAVTKNAFANISKKTAVISFKNVVIKRIEKDAFDGFDDLEVVIVEDSNIGSIDSTAFNLSELDTISFTRTTFGETPNLSSSSVEELIFNDCKLIQVPNVDKLPALTFLNLANNLIENIDEMTFTEAYSLEEVNLSNNSIKVLPVNLFVNNPDFNTLNVDYNPLQTLNLKSTLELLSLKNCNLTNFDRSSTTGLESLSSLDLSGNQLSILPLDTFNNMKDLTYLDLSNNNLLELDDNIFYYNAKLDKIILDNNHFETLPNFQKNVKSFETYHFSCKNCNLKSINNAFEYMQALVTIDLSHNKIENIDGVFNKMHGLKELWISHNNINSIGPNTFNGNDELTYLNISHNPLKTIDLAIFASLTSLRKLDISYCNLQLFATNTKIIALEQLFMGNNNLSVIPVDYLPLIPNLKLLDIHANPLKCTGELEELLIYLINHSIYSNDQVDILKTHEPLVSKSPIDNLSHQSSWKQQAKDCNMNLIFDDEAEDDGDDDDYEDDNEDDGIMYQTETTMKYDFDQFSDDYYSEEDGKDNVNDVYVMDASIVNTRNISLARASYILSITSVFILTALVVLTVAVAVTLLILRRNKSFNIHNGNLPRLKIPLWYTTPGQKRHSGSVYKPLSEDLSGPRTPIINRYEFKQTPQVHNSIP